jgi:hypothetical protein
MCPFSGHNLAVELEQPPHHLIVVMSHGFRPAVRLGYRFIQLAVEGFQILVCSLIHQVVESG